MKALLTSSVALVLLTGAALAQAANPAPAPAAPGAVPAPLAGPADAPPPPPPGGLGVMQPPPGGPGAMQPPPGGPGGPGGMADRGPDGRRLPPPPPPPRGAHIHLQRGDLVLDVKCNDDESTKNCGDTALQMLDRIQNLPKAQ